MDEILLIIALVPRLRIRRCRLMTWIPSGAGFDMTVLGAKAHSTLPVSLSLTVSPKIEPGRRRKGNGG